MIYPRDAFAYTLFCDDVRREDNGKDILIGVYADALIVPRKLPIVIPQMFAVVHYVEPDGFTNEAVRMQIFVPGRKDALVEHEILGPGREDFEEPLTVDDDAMSCVTARWAIPLRTLRIAEPGYIKVRLQFGESTIFAGALEILVQETGSPA
jgi:Family of unknown function (DUF6941)